VHARQIKLGGIMVLSLCRLVGPVQELKSLGGFKNIRKVCLWEGHTLEIDETCYDWGTVYEVECETDQPHAVRDQLGEYLTGNGIGFKYNTNTKFMNFVNRTLD
jgi:uncharacterized protein YjbK